MNEEGKIRCSILNEINRLNKQMNKAGAVKADDLHRKKIRRDYRKEAIRGEIKEWRYADENDANVR